MDEIVDVFLSWQFVLVGCTVYLVFKLFNQVVGPQLWKVVKLRKALKYLEASKTIWPPLMGFGLGWIPTMPKPEPLAESSSLTVAMLFLVAGLFSSAIVKGVHKALESRGINIDLDVPPKQQKKLRMG